MAIHALEFQRQALAAQLLRHSPGLGIDILAAWVITEPRCISRFAALIDHGVVREMHSPGLDLLKAAELPASVIIQFLHKELLF